MKITLKLVLAIVAIALCSNISAQNLKLAHIDIQQLVASMPEYDSAMVKFQKFYSILENELEEMRVELNRKYEDFTKNQANMTDLVKQSRADELQNIQNRIQMFQQSAQESIQQEESNLMQPVYEKATKAIDTVAKDQGINGVFSAQAFHYKDASIINLLPAVKQHLGITK